ncbi:unnamed protein product [Rotaria magnacalcarata]|uniref:Uncharacterized protein n=1 Tax=Rotaria magnacalcarata TaxID=392030 RepID=A0A819QAG8_9BILA|nr:unnamed protein product [Rotaria magnacalcarata]CAF1942027.1 unnamed protein product [Rotaria magnacalcarata]CAF4021618.1 unnamed protein product [Rotaria magnacalcarata]CAF4064545.1 unnamed protein product [Rotaria magnacalcarata]
MYGCERINKQLNDYYSFVTSIIHFLEKFVNQFHKSLINYSFVLKHFHKKSTNLLTKTNSIYESTQQLYHAFSSLTQTFDDEYYHLAQRTSFLKVIQLTIENLKQQMNSSIYLKQKNKLHKYTNRIIRLNRNRKRQYLYQLVQQIRKHDKLALTSKDNLDNIALQTTRLLWKLFSCSPYKFNVQSTKTSSTSLRITDANVDVPCIEHSQSNERLPCPIEEIGSGDQPQEKQIKETIPHEFNQEQRQLSNSNNALIIPVNSKISTNENRSVYSTDIDETIVEKNRLFDEDEDEDDRWIKLVIQNEIQWQKTALSISTDQSSDDNESINKEHRRTINAKNSIHLSDISYTTDYYSQNESD